MEDSTEIRKEAAETECSIDRLSQLPQPVLHHILCFLSQKEAFQTCVLSKTWRYIGSTLPKFEFREFGFPDRETFPGYVYLDNALQRYYDQKLCIQKFRLQISVIDSDSVLFLEKWIPVVMLNMGVKEFEFSFSSSKVEKNSAYIDMPLAFFESESLQKLCLGGCKLNQYPTDSVKLFKHLKTLSLTGVYIEDETLDKILSSCHLIENLVLHSCKGLRSINVNKARNKLKLIDIRAHVDDSYNIKIDVPTIETIIIDACRNWLDLYNNLFAHLKSLYLGRVRLSEKSFDNFSSNFPCLERLSLNSCDGFIEFNLSSRSIKHLAIQYKDRLVDGVIDTPSLVEFKYEGFTPLSINFKSTASEWKSEIFIWSVLDFHDLGDAWWFLKLRDVLEALNESEISLDIEQELRGNMRHMKVGPPPAEVLICGGLWAPVVVERLCLMLNGHSLSTIPVLMSNLFYISRPRNMSLYWYSDPYELDELIEFLKGVFISERQMRHYAWLQDLEDVSIEQDFTDEEYEKEVRFRLRWRD